MSLGFLTADHIDRLAKDPEELVRAAHSLTKSDTVADDTLTKAFVFQRAYVSAKVKAIQLRNEWQLADESAAKWLEIANRALKELGLPVIPK